MADLSKKNLIEKYFNKEKIPLLKNKPKINDEKINIPTLKNFNELFKYNYNLAQLKIFAKHYQQKTSGNKNELLRRIYGYLYLSSYILKIQKNVRRYIIIKYKSLRGPAALNRKLCTNENDFVTLEPINEIPFIQFMSYKDNDGFIYGFDISSLFNLYNKVSSENKKNPYNREVIPKYVFENMKRIMKISRIFKIKLNLRFETQYLELTGEKAIVSRTLKLFQTIDELGNYSDAKWFISLNKYQLFDYCKNLTIIWNSIPFRIRRNIYPINPHYNPFINLSTQYIRTEDNIWNIKKVVLEVMEKLVNNGIDKDSKCLGAYYVLGALTLVNHNAATSIPWLFEAFQEI